MKTINPVFNEIKSEFEKKSGLSSIQSELREREGNDVLLLKIANPTERLFKILEQVRSCFGSDESDAPLVTLVKKSGSNLLQDAEGKLLLRTLSESLNINRYSFQKDFLSRYTRSVAGAEEQITSSANHMVFGRRGAGKSTLLLYALHTKTELSRQFAWIDMQVYARRNDDTVLSDVICEVLEQTSSKIGSKNEFQDVLTKLKQPDLDEEIIRKQLPIIRRLLSTFANKGQELFIFLDDVHVLDTSLQPRLLDMLYAMCRGNKIFLKMSAIETLTRTFDLKTKQGLEIPHDVQLIRLDYNLTTPDKAAQHIETILDSHAIYCGIPSIRRLCTSSDVIPRLTWVAAGVPRDALNVFSQAMTKATLSGKQNVTVSNINIAASEAVNTKLRELESDVTGDTHPLQTLLEDIRDFCVKKQRNNAFFVEIKTNDKLYQDVLTLVDLRLLHVINEGITIGEAGRKYLGLILDYGFYTGIRAAQSVVLFNRETGKVSYKDLRKLPVFKKKEL